MGRVAVMNVLTLSVTARSAHTKTTTSSQAGLSGRVPIPQRRRSKRQRGKVTGRPHTSTSRRIATLRGGTRPLTSGRLRRERPQMPEVRNVSVPALVAGPHAQVPRLPPRLEKPMTYRCNSCGSTFSGWTSEDPAHPEDGWLTELCAALGWQGGTIHDALKEVRRLSAQPVAPSGEPTTGAREALGLALDACRLVSEVKPIPVSFLRAKLEAALAAHAAPDGDARDAARYRFIRAAENARGDGEGSAICKMWAVVVALESTPEQMDAAIDAAMHPTPEKE